MELEEREKRKNIIKEVEVKEERREDAVKEIIKTIEAKVEVKEMRISGDRDREREMIMIGK